MSSPRFAADYRHGTPAEWRARFTVAPEDFRVDEIPLFPPSGEGTHLFLEVEKRGISTLEAARRLARHLGRRPGEIGRAGLKDAGAVTTQTLSIEHVAPAEVEGLELPGLRVLAARRHGHKLRVGHLAGNLFTIVLRDLPREDRSAVDRVAARISEVGLLNWFGPQRFGRGGASFELGRLLVQRRHREYLAALCDPVVAPARRSAAGALEIFRAALSTDAAGPTREEAEGVRARATELGPDLAPAARAFARGEPASACAARIPRSLRQLHVSAFQAHVFHGLLAERADTVDTPSLGDAVFLHDRGATFVVEDEDDARARAAGPDFELSVSGPIFGHRMLNPEGEALALETRCLEREGVVREDFGRIGGGLNQKGARRPLRVHVRELTVEHAPGATRLVFRLPKGSYATVLLEEMRKTFRPGGGDREKTSAPPESRPREGPIE